MGWVEWEWMIRMSGVVVVVVEVKYVAVSPYHDAVYVNHVD